MKLICNIFLFAALILFSSSSHAVETPRLFLDGINQYQEENYTSAIEIFQQIADSGVQNGKLFYNLGNACLKNNDLGHAVLWYERALKHLPHDPDLHFNYEYALTLVKDERGEKEVSIFRIIFFWKYMLTEQNVRNIAIFLNLVFWLVLSYRIIRRKKRFRFYLYLLLIPTVIFTATAFYTYYENSFRKKAVILAPEISVRSGFSVDATVLFVLHAGTKVIVEKEHKAFYRIRYSEDKIGWITRQDAGVI